MRCWFFRGASSRPSTPSTTPIVCTTRMPTFAEVILGGLAKGWPKGKVVPLKAETEQALEKLLTTLTPAGKSQLLKLAAAWGSQGLAKYAAEAAQGLLAVIADEKRSDAAR